MKISILILVWNVYCVIKEITETTMIAKPKKTRVLSLSIIQNAIEAIEETGEIDDQVKSNVEKYNLGMILDYYDDTVEELKYYYQKRKADLVKINELYITRERLYRILNPTIYLNAYKEKRASDALYINANVGFIDEKGKVKNVVVFMGKADETNLEKLKKKIEKDSKFIEDAKKKVIEKLVSKVNIPSNDDLRRNWNKRHLKKDAKPEFNKMSEILLDKMKKLVEKVGSQNEIAQQDQKKSEALILIKQFLKSLEGKDIK
jgi:hypothetical protein